MADLGKRKSVGFAISVDDTNDKVGEEGGTDVSEVLADDVKNSHGEVSGKSSSSRQAGDLRVDTGHTTSRGSTDAPDSPTSPTSPSSQTKRARIRRQSTCSLDSIKSSLKEGMKKEVDDHGSVKSVKLARKSPKDVKERLNFARMCIHFCKSKIHVENNSNPLNRALSERNRQACAVDEEDKSSSSEDEQKQFHCGYLLDVVKRKGYKDGRHPDRGGSKRKLLKELKQHDERLYDYCMDSLKRDEFLSNMIEDVTEYYKNPEAVKFTNAGAAASNVWKHTDVKAIREQVAKIIEHKREVKCFSSAVRQWLLRWSLQNAYVIRKMESSVHKKNRLDEFWKQCRDYNVSNDMPLRHDKDDKKAREHGNNKQKAMCSDAGSQWNMIDRIDARNSTNSCPSTGFQNGGLNRGGAVKYGWMWNMEKKQMRWQPTGPFEGSRAFNKLKQMQAQKADPNARLQSNTGLKTSYFPSLSTDRHDAKSPSGLRISVSEPSLSTPTGKSSSPVSRSPSKGVRLPSLHKNRYLPVVDQPTEKYLETCKKCCIMPTPLPFVTGHSFNINVADINLRDADLRAVVAIMKDVAAIDEIDLSDNVLLTENVFLPFFERLSGEPAASSLVKLMLRNLKSMSVRSFESLTHLLSDSNGLGQLQVLDLGGCQIPPKSQLKLAAAIRDHASLESLSLQDTEMGVNSWIAQQCVEHLLASATLKKLEIGWNCFDVDVFCHMGKCLVKSAHLKSFSIANCSSAAIDVHGRPPPITFFLESLAYDTSLTYLDCSLNRMDLRAALILEDSLEKNRRLEWLEISNNALGTMGIRSLLRLLATKHNALTYVECKGCYDGGSISPTESFNGVNPGGNYVLDLSRPYHRSILRMLYKTCEKFNQVPEQAFFKVKYSGRGAWSHAQRNAAGSYDLPQEGTLTFLFSMKNIFEQAVTGVSEDCYGEFVDEHMKRTKTVPAFHKLIPIFATWKMLEGHQKDQFVFLSAMAKDFMLSAAHVEQMCTSCSIMRGETIFRLFPAVVGGELAEALCMLMFKTIGQFLKFHKELRVFIDFNVENPTGHYKLKLDNPTHYAIVEKLLLIDHWETVLDKRHGRVDISNWNNGSHFRNETYKNIRFTILDWMLPDCEEVEFDYVSRKRMHKDAAVLSDAAFDNVLTSLYDAECSSESKLEVMQMISHLLTISSMHMRKMLGTFKDPDTRAKAFVIFFLRVADMWNSKIFRVRFDDAKTIQRLRSSLGDVLFFPFIQPENAQFKFDFNHHDQRLCCTFLLMMAGKEGMGNLRNYHYIQADGVEANMSAGVPKSWERLKDVPTGGVFTCNYICAPENRRFKERLKLAHNFAVFNMEVEENEVQWATGLSEVDDDVLIFLEHLVVNFQNVGEAFTLIDGEGGNGVITFIEFKEGMKNMKFDRFQKPRQDELHLEPRLQQDAQKRMNNLFRYLDPGGEGSVSKEEWGVLDQLWYEYQLCIYEFVHFLQRTFGDDLLIAWGFLEECAKRKRLKDQQRRAKEAEERRILAEHARRAKEEKRMTSSEEDGNHGEAEDPKEDKEKHQGRPDDQEKHPEHANRASQHLHPSDHPKTHSRPTSATSHKSDKSDSSDKKKNAGAQQVEQVTELTCDEWVEACEDIGYFGPAKCVFGLLDHSGDGNISKDEFDILEKYKFAR